MTKRLSLSTNTGFALFAFLLFVVTCCAAQAATLSFGRPVQEGNGLWGVPVLLHAADGESVAGLQFRLHFEQRGVEVVNVLTGPAAAGAGKEAACTVLQDGARVVVAGMNLGKIADGEVAQVHLKAAGESGDPGGMALDSPVLCDAMGRDVQGTVENGSVTCASPASDNSTSTEAKKAAGTTTPTDVDGNQTQTADGSVMVEGTHAAGGKAPVNKAGTSANPGSERKLPAQVLGRVPGGNLWTPASARSEQGRGPAVAPSGSPLKAEKGRQYEPGQGNTPIPQERQLSDTSPSTPEAFRVAGLTANPSIRLGAGNSTPAGGVLSPILPNVPGHPGRQAVRWTPVAAAIAVLGVAVRRRFVRRELAAVRKPKRRKAVKQSR